MALARRSLTVVAGKVPRTLQQAIESFIADCKARNLSPCTLTLNRTILRELAAFAGTTQLHELAGSDLRRLLIEKASATSPATAARYYDCLAAFFRFLESEGIIPESPMAGVAKPRAPVPVILPLSQEQVEAMLAACPTNTFRGLRDLLVLLILIDCGLRASELCNLTLADADIENQQFIVRHGKGGKSRRVPFGGAVAGVLRQYLARRAEVDTPNLIVNVFGEPIDRYRMRAIVKEAAQRAGVDHPHMGPHLLRHTFAVSYLRAGGDTFSLQKILGHSTLVMTRRYSELADTDVADKHRLFSPADRLNSALTAGERRRKWLR